jgi:enoyl-CoA hydratase/carnithine racemase
MTLTILQDRDEGVMTLVLNRPEKRNALGTAMYCALTDALHAAAGDPSVGAVLLMGQAGAFCSGNEIEAFLGPEPVGVDHPVFAFMHALADCPKPVVAAVDGMAIGIGATLLLHCDLVYASPRARLQFPFARLGLCPEFASSLLLPKVAGRVWAAEALLLGEPISAEKAHHWGLVNEILPEAALEDHARNRARALAALPAAAVLSTRRLLRAAEGDAVAQALAREQQAFLALLATDSVQQGFRDFLAARAARG